MRLFIVKALLHFFSWLPLPLNHALGYLIGLCCYLLPTEVKRISAINLSMCMADLSEAQRRRLLRQSLTEMGKSVTELGPMWLWNPKRVLKQVRGCDNEEVVQQALQQQNGMILLTPHLGCWELTSLYYSQFQTLTCLYRPPKLKGFEEFLTAARQRSGAHLVPTNTTGVKALYAALGRGETIGILPDQDPGKGAGSTAPFFGVDANTVKLIPRLIHKTGAPVVMIYARRLSWGRGYWIHYKSAPQGIHDQQTDQACCAMNQGVESCIRDNLTQYQWAYKRFKTCESGVSPYDR